MGTGEPWDAQKQLEIEWHIWREFTVDYMSTSLIRPNQETGEREIIGWQWQVKTNENGHK